MKADTATISRYNSTWLPVALVMIILCARWILVIGFGDFGGDYDIVSRLRAGQWQGRDFFAVLSFGSSYSVLLFTRLFGDHFLSLSIHVWFWWFMNAASAGGIAIAAKASKAAAAFSVCAVALLTAPPNTHFSAFGFMASALSGFAAILLIQHFQRASSVGAALAGVLGGITIFTKPNEGVALVVGAIALCVSIALLQPSLRRRGLVAAAMLMGGVVVGGMAVLAVPGYVGGYGELLREMFFGAAEIKGGAGTILLRVFPRISTGIASPHRFIYELALTIPVLAGFLALFGRLFGRQCEAPERMNHPERTFLWLVCGAVLALSIWSVFPLDFPARLAGFFFGAKIVSLPFFLSQMLYLLELAGLFAIIFRALLEKQYRDGIESPLWLAIMTLFWTLGVVASGRYNSVFATTLLIPLLALGMKYRRLERAFYRGLAVFLIGWTFAWHIAPNWKSTFAHLTRLPDGSRFAGLYWPEGGASVPGSYPLWSSRMIEQCQKNIAPRVAGHSTLWLTPAAGAAFGGMIYTYGLNGMASNYITPAAEARLERSVTASPPDYVVAADFEEWKDGRWRFLTPSVIQPWLQGNYDLVWSLKDNPAPLFLWRRKLLEPNARRQG